MKPTGRATGIRLADFRYTLGAGGTDSRGPKRGCVAASGPGGKKMVAATIMIPRVVRSEQAST